MDSTSFLTVTCVNWDIKSLLLFTIIFILTMDCIKSRRPASFPPGPWALPVVGNIFSLDHKKTHESMTKLAKKYGKVYSLRMGREWYVILNGFDVLKEALVNQGDGLADRPPLPMVMDLNNGLGIGFTNGQMWKQQRRFTLSTLRHFGLGKKSLESIILDEFTHCLINVQSYKGKPFNPHLIINNAVSNIICSLVFGHRFEYDDEKFKQLIGCFEKGLQSLASIWGLLYNSFPRLMKRLPGPHQTFLYIFNEAKEFIREEIEKHKQDWDPSHQRDYIDCYLNEIQMPNLQSCHGLCVHDGTLFVGHLPDRIPLYAQKVQTERFFRGKKQTGNTFDEENLVACVLDLFVAGSETTSTSLRWALLYMAKYPEIQANVQAEIDRVIGRSGKLSMEDRVDLPYTEAVLHEIQRKSNIIPLSVPHMTNTEIQLKGYTVPKGVTVIPNLTSVLYDKDEWETPFAFNPGHFLTEDGKFVKPAAFIPFSAGKRLCLGENMAKMELFLFFTSLMQHFTFSMPAGVKPVMNYHFGTTLTPHHYEICATSRLEKL